MVLGPLLGAQILGSDDALPEWTRELREDSGIWGGAPFQNQEKNLAGPFVFCSDIQIRMDLGSAGVRKFADRE